MEGGIGQGRKEGIGDKDRSLVGNGLEGGLGGQGIGGCHKKWQQEIDHLGSGNNSGGGFSEGGGRDLDGQPVGGSQCLQGIEGIGGGRCVHLEHVTLHREGSESGCWHNSSVIDVVTCQCEQGQFGQCVGLGEALDQVLPQ